MLSLTEKSKRRLRLCNHRWHHSPPLIPFHWQSPGAHPLRKTLRQFPCDLILDRELRVSLAPSCEGWKEEFTDRTESLSTTEYIPEGQSEADWEEMLTIQILLNKPSADPVKMMSRITKYLSQDCKAFEYRPIDIGGIDNNYPSLAVMALCGQKKEENNGYMTLLRGISGEENYFLLQKTWKTKFFDTQKKSPINLEQRKFWLGYLSYLRICNRERGDCPKDLKLN